MNAYSKHDDINTILMTASSQLQFIESQYSQSLHSQNISNELLSNIKDYLGNLRSSLDYLVNKFPGYQGNFPISNSELDFVNKTKKMPQNFQDKLLKWQPFNNNSWISWFNILNNKHKHVSLIPQKRVENIQTTVSNSQGSVSWSSGVTFGPGVSIMGIPVDPTTQLPVPNSIVKTERVTWIDFLFDNSVSLELPNNLSALPFLKDCFDKVKNIVKDLEY